MDRRNFLVRLGAAAVAATLPVPAAPKLTVKMNLSYWEKYHLWKLHNRIREGQRVFVWADGARHSFTTVSRTIPPKLATDRKWTYIGELHWIVDAEGRYFEHHLLPV